MPKEARRFAVPEAPPPEKRIGRRRFGRPVMLDGLFRFPIYLPGNAPTVPKPLARNVPRAAERTESEEPEPR